MKKFKKLLVVFTFIILLGGLTACSSINKVSRNFDEAGYSLYEYNFKGDSNLFAVADGIAQDLNVTVEITTGTTEENPLTTTTSGDTTETVVTTNPLAAVLGFRAYAFSNSSDRVVIVLEFESEEYMNQVLEDSSALQAAVEGLDPVDYINGNCILLADASYYDEVVEIFQGRYVPESE